MLDLNTRKDRPMKTYAINAAFLARLKSKGFSAAGAEAVLKSILNNSSDRATAPAEST